MSAITITQPAGTATPTHGPDTAPRGTPIGTFAGLPLYKYGTAPAYLRTRSQLERGLRLTPAPGQRPVCYVRPYFHPDERRPLYDPAQAVRVVRTVGDDWVWRMRRTCPRCGELREHLTHNRPCGACRRADRERAAAIAARTCDECRRIGAKPYPQVLEGWYAKRLCRSCTAARKRKLDALLTEAATCPGGCGKRTATKKTVLAWALANHRAVASWTRLHCPPCGLAHRIEQERLEAERAAAWERRRAEQAEQERQAAEARRREVADLAAWARDALNDPDTVILDTETTGLHDEARIVDIAVTTARGDVLLDTLVNPGEPIPAEATAIHGITDAMVADAPTFGEVLPRLTTVVSSKRLLIYNDVFDVARIRHEMTLLGEKPDPWFAAVRVEDVMIHYSDWVGDWSDYHGNYSWQPLNGGHRALGDCHAVIERLREMARSASGEGTTGEKMAA